MTCGRHACLSSSSGYHAEFHEGYQKHTNRLNCSTSSSDISGYHAEFHDGYQKHTNQLNCSTSSSDISGYHAEFHEGYQKHTNQLNCSTSSSDISGYHADFHEGHGTVGEWQGRGMGETWARHGMCELALTCLRLNH
jgi:aminoglycoside phosphotransferase family enzyme